MKLELTADQEFFRETTRKFLESESPLTAVRQRWDSPDGFDRGWWRAAADLGWTSLLVPEQLGGGTLSGSPVADAVIVAEEMGRMVAPGPFVPVNVVASTLATWGSADQQALIAGLVSGDEVAAWAFAEPGRSWDADAVRLTLTVDGGDVVLAGRKAYVEAAAQAGHLLVTARADAGLTQVLLATDTAGLTVVPGRSIDIVRRYGSVVFDDVRLPGSALVGEVGGAEAAVERQLQIAVALQCAETVGAADRVFETTVEYAQDRYAFGRPIASFQALKHRIADMLQWLEFSKALSDAAAAAVDADATDGEAARLVSVAKAYIADHCLDIIDDCVQLNGGIGVTWEHDIHLYSRRAAVNRAVWGSPEEHKERVAALLEI
ncbi:MAG: acyl-CoA/acyl-ACP dehydrogenase [Acidobacteria bacterium]|nr:acyl-CoA/acyl-ACP dehydrogenase [Acidobacteriota bacterium]